MKSYPVVTFVCILSYIRVMTLRVPPGLLTSAGGVRQNRTITGNNNIVTIHERVYSFLNYSILKSDSQKYQRTTPLVLLNIIMGLRGFFLPNYSITHKSADKSQTKLTRYDVI